MRVCVCMNRWKRGEELYIYKRTHIPSYLFVPTAYTLHASSIVNSQSKKKTVKDMPVYINVSLSVWYDSLVGCSCFFFTSKMYSNPQNWILVRMIETDTKYIWLSFGEMFLRWCKGLLSHADGIRCWDGDIMLCSGMISLQMQQQKTGGS